MLQSVSSTAETHQGTQLISEAAVLLQLHLAVITAHEVLCEGPSRSALDPRCCSFIVLSHMLSCLGIVLAS